MNKTKKQEKTINMKYDKCQINNTRGLHMMGCRNIIINNYR